MTVRAKHSDMRSGEHKFGLCMSRKTVGRRSEGCLRVARFAAIGISRTRELPGVNIRMAPFTSGGFQFVFRIFSAGLVALNAVHRRVLAFQRESALLVLFASV